MPLPRLLGTGRSLQRRRKPSVNVWQDLGQNSTIAAVGAVNGRRIGPLQEFHNRIYMGYGDAQIDDPTVIHAISWDTVTEQFVESAETINANANMALRVLNDELWAPATDAGFGTFMEYGVVAADHTFTAVNSDSDVMGHHLFDAIYFNGQPYLCGAGYFDGSCSHGRVWRKDAGGWVQSLNFVPSTCNGIGYRAYALFVLNGFLYTRLYGDQFTMPLKRTADGVTWADVPGVNTTTMILPMNVSGAVLYRTTLYPMGTTTSLRRYDGSAETTVIASGVKSHYVASDGTPFALLTSEIRQGTQDGTSFTTVVSDCPTNGTSLCVTNEYFYVGTADSHLWRKRR